MVQHTHNALKLGKDRVIRNLRTQMRPPKVLKENKTTIKEDK